MPILVEAREQILRAVKTVMDTLASVALARNRTETIKRDELPILVLYDAGYAPQRDFTGERNYVLTVEIEGAAGGATPTAAEQAANLLRARLEAALLADVTLAGKARDLRPGRDDGTVAVDLAAAVPVASFVRRFDVEYATPEDDPYTLV